MINEDEGEIHPHVKYTYNKIDKTVQNLVTAAGKSTKLDFKIYYEMMENREQILSIRLQSASSEMSDKINYYFTTIQYLFDRPYVNKIKTASRMGTPNEIISFFKLMDKNLSYDSERLNIVKLNGTLFPILTPLKLKFPTTLLNHYKVILSNLLGTTSNQPYPQVL